MTNITNLEQLRAEWRTLSAGPLRVRVTVEREDGTELYHLYPFAGQHLEYGMTISVTDHQLGDIGISDA
jgi:hypothetical protein